MNNNNNAHHHEDPNGAVAAANGGGGVCYDQKRADAVLANDLNTMTVDERNSVLDDIHGVRSLNLEDEDPSKLVDSLVHMNHALERIEPKTAFHMAVRLDSQYVLRDKHLRVRFLRAEEFDATKAARRFVDYLDFTHELFGAMALMRPIYFYDLTKNEQLVLREGGLQLLPCRDRAGRRILTRIGYMGGPKEKQFTPSLLRVAMYLLQVLACDEKTQQLGCVLILHSGYNEDITTTTEYNETSYLREPNMKENLRKLFAAFPVRVSAYHLCTPNTPTYQLAAAALSLIAPTIMRIRLRVHFGTQIECRYSLMAFGIPSDQLPITLSGRIKTVNHHRSIKYQRKKEDTIQMGLPPFEGVDCPLGMDILIGLAGHNNSSHLKNSPGNILYLDLIDAHFSKYENAGDTSEKTRITWIVLEELGKAGGRILVRDRRGWWLVASADKAREKIAHGFKETRKRNLALSNFKKRPSVESDASSTMGFAARPDDTKKRCFRGNSNTSSTNININSNINTSSDEDSDVIHCMAGVFR